MGTNILLINNTLAVLFAHIQVGLRQSKKYINISDSTLFVIGQLAENLVSVSLNLLVDTENACH